MDSSEAANAAAAARYSRGAMALHWIIALLIVLNFIGAWEAEDLEGAEKAYAMAGHKAFGITILTLTVLRIVWRFTHKPPPLLESLKAWEAAFAKVTHSLFYFLMLAVPLAGWSLHSAASNGKPVAIFGLTQVPALPVGSDKPTVGMFHDLHETFATLLLVLLVLHVAAALKHALIDRDGTLRRMVPFVK
jgi:cytochrome b561